MTAGAEATVVVRADASRAIGGGHVVRAVALADGLAARGWRCVFASTGATATTVPALADAGHEIVRVDDGLAPEAEAAAIGERLGGGADWLVVDHYGRDTGFHRACRAWARRVLVVDELADRGYDADLLVDPTPERDPADYQARIPAGCELLLGPRYALLRPEFVVARPAALARREDRLGVNRILVSFGTVDARNLTAVALDGIRASGVTAAVDVVLGPAAVHGAEIDARCAAMPFPVTVHRAVDDMAALMAAADLAIGAGGTTTWERCCLGLPALVVVDADNQAVYAQRLAAAGAGVDLGGADGLTPDAVAEAIAALQAAPSRLYAMARAAAGLCDGEGVVRVADRMAAM